MRQADGRFVGQGFNLTVRLPQAPYAGAGAPDAQTMREALIVAFKSGYQEKFGRMPPDVAIELVNLRVTGEAPPRQQLVPEQIAAGAAPKRKATRAVYFHEIGAHVDTPIYERDALLSGFSQQGPMLIEDASSTLVVGPKGHVKQLESGNLIISIQDSL
jgi:N-methylhydantoinase A